MREKILIGGGTGLVGSRLLELIDYKKYEVYILTRSKRKATDNIKYFSWDFSQMRIEEGATKVDHIINLTGAGIADKRWSNKRKKILIESRVKSLQLIEKGISQDQSKPKVLISASAIGYYGDRGAEVLDESSEAGVGFMSDCCLAWEEAAFNIKGLFDRLIISRVGIVLSTKGGALPKILMTKSIGVYNYFGNGQQYYSWVHIDDLCQMFISKIEHQEMHGIYNAVSPQPLTNKDFASEIKTALGGMVVLPAPAIGLRLVLGEMADVVLNSNKVIPTRLQELDYDYNFADLQEAVKDLIDRKI